MPEHIRALIVVAFLGFIGFYLSRQYIYKLSSYPSFEFRIKAWFVLTFTAFTIGNFFLFCLVAIIACFMMRAREVNRLGFYYGILFLIPPLQMSLSGGGILNQLFSLSFPRLLSLFILLPIAIQGGHLFKVKNKVDYFVIAYVLLISMLVFTNTTFTNALRYSFYYFLDMYLPYLVFSRYFSSIKQIYDAILSYVSVMSILALIAIVEFARNWLLFSAVVGSLGISWGINDYIGRAGHLRAMASTVQPIALGYVLTVAIGFWLVFKNYTFISNDKKVGITENGWKLILIVLSAGLIASLSRGPWVAMLALLMVFVVTGPNIIKTSFRLFLTFFVGTVLAMMTESGRNIIDTLPFIGSAEQNNVEYRQQLLEATNSVIARYPWFGNVNYRESPEFLAIGPIVDVVNSYVGIALNSGGVGVFLFVMIFVTAIVSVYSSVRKLPKELSEYAVLGRALVAILIATMVTIATVSSISFIPVVYWSLLGMSTAYVRLVKSEQLAR